MIKLVRVTKMMKVVAMEEEMMVSPAFIKKTAGVRGEEDEETGGSFMGEKPLKQNWRKKHFYEFCFRKQNLLVLKQCCVQWFRRKSARLQHVKLLGIIFTQRQYMW